MKVIYSYFVLFCLLLGSLAVNAQRTVSSGGRSQGIIPNEFIVHYNIPTTEALAAERAKSGVSRYLRISHRKVQVDARALDAAGHDFELRINISGGRVLDACRVLGDHHRRRNSGVVSGDGVWPNYYIGTGGDPGSVSGALQGQIAADCIPEYVSPLKGCSSRANLAPLKPFERYATPTEQVDIAIFDSGVNFSRYSLFGEVEVIHHKVSEELGSDDDFGHGTAVASVLLQHARRGSDIKRVKVHSYKVLDGEGNGRLSDLIAGLNLAATNKQLDLVNFSLGWQPEACDALDYASLINLLQSAKGKSPFVLTSAGNHGGSIDAAPYYPATAFSGLSTQYTVGATDCRDRRAEFSGYGASNVDLLVPGTDIMVYSNQLDCYVPVSGTSFATPLVGSVIVSGLLQGYSNEVIQCMLGNRATSADHFNLARLGVLMHEDEATCAKETYYAHLWGKNAQQEEDGATVDGAEGGLSIQPNPISGRAQLLLDESLISDGALLLITDSYGRVLQEMTPNGVRVPINLSSAKPGVYYARLHSAGKVLVRRFVKH